MNPAPIGDWDRREVYLNAYMSNEGLDLLAVTGIDTYRERGQMVESVEITFSQLTSETTFQLYTENETLDAQLAIGHSTLLIPQKVTLVGVNMNSLSLWVDGGAVIEKIAVNLSHETYNRAPSPAQNVVYLPANLMQNFNGQSTVDLFSLAGLNQYRGYRLQSVTIQGSSLSSGGASAQVLADLNFIGYLTFESRGTDVQQMYPQNKMIIGQNLNRLRLMIPDATRIDWIELRVSRY